MNRPHHQLELSKDISWRSVRSFCCENTAVIVKMYDYMNHELQRVRELIPWKQSLRAKPSVGVPAVQYVFPPIRPVGLANSLTEYWDFDRFY
jgi:hypothetical protein